MLFWWLWLFSSQPNWHEGIRVNEQRQEQNILRRRAKNTKSLFKRSSIVGDIAVRKGDLPATFALFINSEKSPHFQNIDISLFMSLDFCVCSLVLTHKSFQTLSLFCFYILTCLHLVLSLKKQNKKHATADFLSLLSSIFGIFQLFISQVSCWASLLSQINVDFPQPSSGVRVKTVCHYLSLASMNFRSSEQLFSWSTSPCGDIPGAFREAF